jgi:ABC-type bacteriocin/lantibiotic exporter with double-glycine peptidase domain
MEEVIRAAMTTRAHDFINETPLRYQTMLQYYDKDGKVDA